MSNNLNKVTLVGLGAIALEYTKVLKSLNSEITAIGRSESSCEKFTKDTDIKSFVGGVLKNKELISDTAIVSASVESLAEITMQLIESGAKKILVEKPGALNAEDLIKIKTLAEKANSQVYIAYNRRFLPSTLELIKKVKAEGGAQTGFFEFTEWSHVIDKLPDSPAKQTTFLSNSTHIIDLAFFLMGAPKEYSTYTTGENKFTWNKGPSQFVGSGITKNDVLFCYHANWTSAGRWGVEVLTKESRYILRPVEKLFRQPVGSIKIEEITLSNTEPADLKPGLYNQVSQFLNTHENTENYLVTLNEQIEMYKHYNKINFSNAHEKR
ncbi:MAG: Gfo/Idh/MocA family oxidoreductase [Bdellovibrionota bacterium]